MYKNLRSVNFCGFHGIWVRTGFENRSKGAQFITKIYVRIRNTSTEWVAIHHLEQIGQLFVHLLFSPVSSFKGSDPDLQNLDEP
jgi:hypothetical protein